MALSDGLYDLLLTEGLARSLATLDPGSAEVLSLKGGAPDMLVDVITRQLGAILDDVSGDDTDKPRRQLELVNELLVMLRHRLADAEDLGPTSASAEVIDLVAQPLRVLRAVQRDRQFQAAPEIGLAAPWLFTAGKGSPSLLQEIRRELASADQVDILVSFITVSGVRKLQDVLQQITATGAQGQSAARLRILTTTYTGATEARALDELARLPGCEVRVSLDGRRTRLHAKAWLFQRRTGFGSAYVGSANLSGAALTGGLEWTVKLTQRAQEALFTRAIAHFETLWADSEFQRYDPDNALHRQALAVALGRESFGGEPTGAISFFDLQPKTYQQDMLEQLAAERAHGRHRNLVVAATGTGKTVVAAFDYRNTCCSEGGRPRMLFVAHREEILRQALRTYREVLRDPEFGELLTGGHEPERRDHLFATIDSVTSRDLVAAVGAEHWHTIVVDECHRLAADRFDAFVKAVRPSVLLGLTATPERSDGHPPTLDAKDALGLQMLAYQIDGRHEQAAGPEAFIDRIDRHPAIAAELVELSGLLQARSTLGAKPVPGLEDTPLCLHAAYGAREVLTAVGWLTAARRAPFQAGVLPLTNRKIELLFVTLDKSEGYHDRISYHDYAISVDRFHWQTQNSAGPNTPGGRRYLESSTNGWQFQLFVRPRKGDAYRACGRVALESAEGDRPMSIVWKLETPLPVRLFREFSVLRGV